MSGSRELADPPEHWMAAESVRVLIVDDEPAHAEAIRRALDGGRFEIQIVQSLAEYRQALADGRPDLALVDLLLPDGRAESLLTSPPEAGPFPLVIMTSYGDEQVAVAAMRAGALDYVVKSPEAFAEMPRTIGRALRAWRLLREREATRQELRESEERYRRLFSAELDAIFVVNCETGNFLDANDSALELYGYSREEVLGLTAVDISAEPVASDDADGRVRTRIALRWHRKKDGTIFPVEVTSNYFEAQGRRLQVTAVRDITERQRAEEALRISEERLRLATDAAQIGTWDRDLVTNKLVWSEIEERLMGFEPGTFLGTESAFQELLHPDSMGAHAAAQHRVRHGDGFFEAELRFRLRDGRERWGYLCGRAFRDSLGRLIRIVGIDQDITLRKQSQEQFQILSEQLRALFSRIQTLREEERSRISREIHDELGQMLTGVKMDLRWIERRLDGFGEDRRVNPILDRLVATAELADATIRAVQRIAAELRPGILDRLGLPAALRYEIARFQERTGIFCRLFLPSSDVPLRPEVVTALFRIFQEALTNVARHAIATEVEVELAADQEICRLEVRDNGRGITSHEVTKSDSLGVLGMRERARSLGGSVSFTTRSGGGTVVRVEIPN